MHQKIAHIKIEKEHNHKKFNQFTKTQKNLNNIKKIMVNHILNHNKIRHKQLIMDSLFFFW
jgi:hypothetical protein